MKRFLFQGDSITDGDRNRILEDVSSYEIGHSYANVTAAMLGAKHPGKLEFFNRGISGNRIVDLYARIKKDVWNEKPDVLTILEGINDISHDVWHNNGVEFERWIKMYRKLLEETKEKLPNATIIVGEPFVLHGEISNKNFKEYEKIRERSKALKSLVEELGLIFMPLQAIIDEKAKQYGEEVVLADGVHPTVYGAKLIANEWLKLFREKVN